MYQQHTSLSAAVASLSGGAQRTSVRSSAVSADVAELSAGVALHGLSLAVTGVVVGSAALVAGGGSGTSESSTTSESESSAAHRRSSAESASGGAVASLVKPISTSSLLNHALLASAVRIPNDRGCRSCSI
jgi:hypothetical protein